MRKMMETRAKRYDEIEDLKLSSITTGIKKLDEMISNEKGFITPSTILLTGSSGAGKTTLIKFIQKCVSKHRTMLLSREMPGSVVKKQTAGIEINHDNAFISDDLNFEEFMKELDIVKPQIVFVDSLQVVAKEDFAGTGESEATFHIIQTIRQWGKENNAVVILVGHVTKDDGFRGDNTIVQMVDAHFEMINDKKAGVRYIKVGQKNRFGDASKMLYYEFSVKNNRIAAFDFFNEDEYNVSGNDVDFIDTINDAVQAYLLKVDKTTDNYKKFYNKFIKLSKKIYASDKSDIEITLDIIKTLNELFEEFEIQ
jgi:predicted ATP-dependent serine protease